jgi:hypothetical protein
MPLLLQFPNQLQFLLQFAVIGHLRAFFGDVDELPKHQIYLNIIEQITYKSVRSFNRSSANIFKKINRKSCIIYRNRRRSLLVAIPITLQMIRSENLLFSDKFNPFLELKEGILSPIFIIIMNLRVMSQKRKLS